MSELYSIMWKKDKIVLITRNNEWKDMGENWWIVTWKGEYCYKLGAHNYRWGMDLLTTRNYTLQITDTD
jgi:hypothetical protein